MKRLSGAIRPRVTVTTSCATLVLFFFFFFVNDFSLFSSVVRSRSSSGIVEGLLAERVARRQSGFQDRQESTEDRPTS